ncbi:MAG: NAD(P)-binding domain-containing protein, partial [Deltaproteobacteria bacterium]|nr:NAD(P)-binding domain-containing protein [Deltaproteobacteria bacterium]
MRIGVLGTGMVGTALATRLTGAGHEVRMGARSATNDAAAKWSSGRAGASNGTFADAAKFGEIVIHATGGGVSVEVLTQAGAENLAGKVLIDVSNPLDFSRGYPRLSVCNDDSAGEQIQ